MTTTQLPLTSEPTTSFPKIINGSCDGNFAKTHSKVSNENKNIQFLSKLLFTVRRTKFKKVSTVPSEQAGVQTKIIYRGFGTRGGKCLKSSICLRTALHGSGSAVLSIDNDILIYSEMGWKLYSINLPPK